MSVINFLSAGKPRFVHGPASAPVTMVEWTDVMCGHCAEFMDTLTEVMARLPAGQVRIEPRQFPLDRECNASMHQSDGTGVRCSAARALVCLDHPALAMLPKGQPPSRTITCTEARSPSRAGCTEALDRHQQRRQRLRTPVLAHQAERLHVVGERPGRKRDLPA